MANKEVIVVPYSSNWGSVFKELSTIFNKYLKDYIIGIEHVGSTSDGSGKQWLRHHLYVCTQDSMGLKNHIHFRGYLRLHPEIVIEYGTLKMGLAKKYTFDIDSYIEGKTDFIISILAKNGFNDEILHNIKQQNIASKNALIKPH